jgi:hypothetical protein
VPLTPESIRTSTQRTLAELGFRFSRGLPLSEPDYRPRPRIEIAGRLLVLHALCIYVSAPEDRFPTAALRARIETHSLADHLTRDERAILDMSRADANAEHAGMIGWKMENMVPLAWALGHEATPRIAGDMIDGDALRDLFRFCPKEPAAFLAAGTLRPADDLRLLEDAFYAAHNAARCAVFGRDPSCVPEGFDPMSGLGVIQERRMALTWMLSPGVAWDDTDLST